MNPVTVGRVGLSITSKHATGHCGPLQYWLRRRREQQCGGGDWKRLPRDEPRLRSGPITLCNRLVVTNGGRVTVSDTIGPCVGFWSNSVGNSVLVSGVGSVWTNAGVLFLGAHGAGNPVDRVERRPSVDSIYAFLGQYESASSNVAVITERAWFPVALRDLQFPGGWVGIPGKFVDS